MMIGPSTKQTVRRLPALRRPGPLKPEEINVPRAQEQLDRGQKMWSEAGESEEAYTEALRVISEAEAKIASASEKH